MVLESISNDKTYILCESKSKYFNEFYAELIKESDEKFGVTILYDPYYKLDINFYQTLYKSEWKYRKLDNIESLLYI